MNFIQFKPVHQKKPVASGKQIRVPFQEILNAVPKSVSQKNSIGNENIPTVIDERPAFIPFHHIEYPIGYEDDPGDVTEYEHIIYRSMRQRDLKVEPALVTQTEITPNDRCILIDNLCRLHYKAQLTTITFYRCVGILDHLTNKILISPYKYLLYGYTAMFIASKYEDVIPLRLKDAVEISGNQFTIDDIKEAEIYLCSVIDFDFTFPTAIFFETIFLRLCGSQLTSEFFLLTRYIMELCMITVDFISVHESAIAAAAVMAARTLFGMESWTEELAGYSQYSFQDLCPYVKKIHQMLLHKENYENSFIKKKYSTSLFKNVANVQVPENLPFPFQYF